MFLSLALGAHELRRMKPRFGLGLKNLHCQLCRKIVQVSWANPHMFVTNFELVGTTLDIFLNTANTLKLRTAKKHFQKNAKKEDP
jgi:hypothetical protein